MGTTKTMKHDIIGQHCLPREARFCETPTTSNEPPQVTLDENRNCTAGNFVIAQSGIGLGVERDWSELCYRHPRVEGRL